MNDDILPICSRLSRRQFLRWAGAGTGVLIAGCNNSGGQLALPVVSEQVVPAAYADAGRVVVVHDSRATTWDGTQTWYGSEGFVDQARVDAMVRAGVLAFADRETEPLAWQKLLPGYAAGRATAVKINENNAGRGGNVIDPLPQLLTALTRTLTAGGVAQADIWFIDPSRTIDDRVARPVKTAFPGVRFYGAAATGYSGACTYTSTDPGLVISHAGAASSRFPDQLGACSYLIHMPILKAHGMAGVTFTYKNLFGLFESSTISKFHDSFFLETDNPMVEIWRNKNVGGKTVLILADAVYGNWENNYSVPSPWTKSFGAELWPKRIFLSRDPVAMDSVLYDFLQWQRQDLDAKYEAYLREAWRAGQGVRDHWSGPSDRKYSSLTFIEREMAA